MSELSIAFNKFEKELVIDKDNLDVICQIHPEIFYQISKFYIEAVSIRDSAKANLEKIEAQVSLSIRSALEKAGEKATEGKVASLVQIDDMKISAVETYLNTKAEADLWQVLKDSYLQRASMIKILADLYGQGYFTTTSLTSSDAKIKENEYKELREKLSLARRG